MNTRITLVVCALIALLYSVAASSQHRQVAITIDDLPRGGDGPYDANSIDAMTNKLLQPFSKQKIPVIGFVNAGRNLSDPTSLPKILDLWLDAGAELGNHSATHPDINNVSLNTYTADILNGERVLRDALKKHGKTLEFYRHPYLHTGATPETKKALQDFLNQHHYRVAPVTLDNADYAFAALYQKPAFRERIKAEYIPYMESIVEFFERRSVEVIGHEIPQILLIHANQLNADLMPDLLAMFKRRGYRFVSLSQALKDPAYQLRDDYVGRRGISWLHRWAVTKGMPNKEEPDAPEWVMKALRESN